VLLFLMLVLIATMPQAALIVLFGGGMVVVLVYLMLRSLLGRYGHQRAERSGARLHVVSEALGSLKEIKVLGREAYFSGKFLSVNGLYLEASRVFATLNAMPRLLIESLVLALLVGAAVAVVIAHQDMQGALPTVALLCVAALRLMPAATRILAGLGSARFCKPALDQVYREISLLEQPRAPLPTALGDPLLLRKSVELRDLRYSYPSGGPALHGISCVIPGGAVSGLVGASGAGKSTVADLILGLLTPSGGAILVDGKDVAGGREGWTRRVGYVPQHIFLLDDSVRRNVAFGLHDNEIDDERVWAALRSARIDDIVRSLPKGLDESIGERGARLSGGQRQRLGIARALYSDPQVLILDEATSALDTQTERAIADTLLEMRPARTVIVIAHRLDTIRRCDWLFFLADGRLLASGNFAELSRDPRFAALVGEARL
jgi:ATP-binding cassette subfamily C protein